MNAVDMIVLGAVGLAALVGLKMGLLKPLTGIGGFALGVFLALQNYSSLSAAFAPYLESEMAQKVAAFIAIVLGVAILTRLVGYIVKKILNFIVMGWLDHVAGMVGAAAVATAIVGTVIYVATGVAGGNEALTQSKLAPQVAKASLVTSENPWCSSLSEAEQKAGAPCTSVLAFAGELIGMDFQQKIDETLNGQDVGELVSIVKGSLSGGSPSELAAMAKQSLDQAKTQAIIEAADKAEEEGTLDALVDAMGKDKVAEIAAEIAASKSAGGVDEGEPSGKAE